MKKCTYLRRVIGLVICAGIWVSLSGCSSITVIGISPVYPEAGIYTSFRVDSLQPELKWKGEDNSEKYDLAIWNTIVVDRNPMRRKVIYERTALSGTAHKIEIVLEPDTVYYWSVRKTGTPAWSEQVHKYYSGDGVAIFRGYFLLHTPTMAELQKKTQN